MRSSTRTELTTNGDHCLKMSTGAPSSPCANSEPDIDDDDPPEADQAGIEGSDGDAPDEGTSPRRLLAFYAKNFFVVNPADVKFDANKPYKVTTGEAMYKVHESKSFKAWDEDYVVRPRNIIKIVANGQCGWYVCFEIDGAPTDDTYVVRSIHKQIAKRFFEKWNTNWGNDRKEKYAELLRDEPSDMPQINPLVVGWEQTEAPQEIVYARPKKEKKDKGDESLQSPINKAGGKGGKGKSLASTVGTLDIDDDQSSAAQSAPPATPNDSSLVGFRPMQQFSMPGSAPQIFLHTPGTVTVSEAWLQQLIANQRP